MEWNARIEGLVLSASSEDVLRMKKYFVGEGDLASRMSELLWFDMMVLNQAFGIAPFEILDAIKEVDSGEQSLRTKKATQFSRSPLKGLWHKHYFSARFLAHNIVLGLGKGGLKRIVEEELDPAKSPVVTEEMIKSIARRTTTEPVEARFNDGKITGEWIVFARAEGKNHYLTAATHHMEDAVIHENIMNGCIRDFPDLPKWFG